MRQTVKLKCLTRNLVLGNIVACLAGTALMMATQLRCLRSHVWTLTWPCRDPDRLDIDELTNPIGAQLAPVAGLFDPTEGQPRVRRNHAVDEHRPRLELVDEARALGRVVGPCTRAESKGRIVGQVDRRVDVA